MPIPDMQPLWLLETCAPRIAPITMAAIVQQESGGDWFAIHDNTAGETLRPTTVEHAVSLARRRIAEGHSIDLGGAQINNANLGRLGLDVGSAFDPCVNLKAAQVLLLDGWRHSGGDLPATLAIYHAACSAACSSAKRSVGVAYSTSVYGEAGVTVPAIPDGHLASWVLPRVGASRPRATISMSPAASSLTPRGDTLSTANQAKPTR